MVNQNIELGENKMQRETMLKLPDKYFILRDVIYKLMLETNENQIIYCYLSKINKEIIYICFTLKCEHLNTEKLIGYKTTLKKLYLYLMIESYPAVPKDCLIIYSNRVLRRLTIQTTAKLLNISEEKYRAIETGKITTSLDFAKISDTLNFNKQEFYYSFKTTFEEI